MSKSRIPLFIGMLMVLASFYFFILSINLMSDYKVSSSILSAIIGFILLSYGTAIIRSWLLGASKDSE